MSSEAKSDTIDDTIVKSSEISESSDVARNQAAPEQKGDKKTKKKASKPRKAKRNFPHNSIEDCRKIADAIKDLNAGNPWGSADVAKAIDSSMSNPFFYLTASSRDYGLTIGTRNTPKIELADLGKSLVYPKSPDEEYRAIENAFRGIDIFRKVYDYYQGENLPDIHYLKNTLKTEFGIDESLQDDFYEIYRKNINYLKSKGESLSPALREGDNVGSGSIILGESSNSGELVAFVAMPFSEKTDAYPSGYFDEVLRHLITPAAVEANFNVKTAKKSGSEVIQSTIVNDLDSADLVVVDLTEHNPNVLFELGMRIAFDKPVCLIRAKGTSPIFDIDHMLRVYDYNPCLWRSTLETDIPALREHISQTWANREGDRSYLRILRENN